MSGVFKLSPSGGKEGVAIIFSEILTPFRQLMMHERGQDLLQLKEQPFAGSILIGVHVEGDPLQTSPRGGFQT